MLLPGRKRAKFVEYVDARSRWSRWVLFEVMVWVRYNVASGFQTSEQVRFFSDAACSGWGRPVSVGAAVWELVIRRWEYVNNSWTVRDRPKLHANRPLIWVGLSYKTASSVRVPLHKWNRFFVNNSKMARFLRQTMDELSIGVFFDCCRLNSG